MTIHRLRLLLCTKTTAPTRVCLGGYGYYVTATVGHVAAAAVAAEKDGSLSCFRVADGTRGWLVQIIAIRVQWRLDQID